VAEDEVVEQEDWGGPERRADDRRSGADRRRDHGFTLRMIHELAQRFEQLSQEGRLKVVDYAKTLLVEEMMEEERQEPPAE
jgi:hypothetical protein